MRALVRPFALILPLLAVPTLAVQAARSTAILRPPASVFTLPPTAVGGPLGVLSSTRTLPRNADGMLRQTFYTTASGSVSYYVWIFSSSGGATRHDTASFLCTRCTITYVIQQRGARGWVKAVTNGVVGANKANQAWTGTTFRNLGLEVTVTTAGAASSVNGTITKAEGLLRLLVARAQAYAAQHP